MKPRIHYTKPSITELEGSYATDPAAKLDKFMPGSHIPILALVATLRMKFIIAVPRLEGV